MRKSVKEHATSAGLGSFLWLLIPITVIAAVIYFIGTEYTSDIGHKTYIKVIDRNPFNPDGSNTPVHIDLGPGESTTIYPTLTNDSSVDVYALYVCRMPIVSFDTDGDGAVEETGLYSIEPSDGWELIENYKDENSDEWVEVYGTYLETDRESTLSNTLTMREIKNSEYGDISDLNISMRGYCVAAEEVDGEYAANLSEAWTIVQNHMQ